MITQRPLESVRTQSAVKILNNVSKLNDKIDTKDKDGDDGPSDIMAFDVQVALNGFFVTISYCDIELADERHVVQTMDEVVELLRSKF